MSAKSLVSRPDLRQYKKQAKDLLEEFKASEPGAIARFKTHVSRLATLSMEALDATDPTLREAQHVIAREHGFAAWAPFKRHIESLTNAANSDVPSPSIIQTQLTAYFAAVRANDAAQVRAILTADPHLVHARIANTSTEEWTPANPDDRQSNTALHWTANPWGQQDQEHAELAQALIDHGADVDALGYNGNKGVAPAVVLAAWEGSLAVLRVLLENGADPNLPGSAESALYTAIEHTAPDAPEPNKISVLLDHGAAHDIFTAAMTGQVDVVETLLDEYAELINRRSLKRNRTPLEEAVYYGQWEVAERLIDHGAPLTVHVPAAMGDVDRLARMLEADLDLLEARDDNQETPLFIAAQHGRTETIAELLDRGADPSTTNRWRITALRNAVLNGNPQAVELLLAAGADATATDRGGKTAFDHIDPEDEAMVAVASRYGYAAPE